MSPVEHFISPEEATQKMVTGDIDSFFDESGVCEINTSVTSTDFTDVIAGFMSLLEDGLSLPGMESVDSRREMTAGHRRVPLTWTDSGLLREDPKDIFHGSLHAYDGWAAGNFDQRTKDFFDQVRELSNLLTRDIKTGFFDLLEDRMDGLLELFFPQNSLYEAFGNPTLRIIAHDSANELADKGIDPSNLPYAKPHVDRSAIGARPFATTDDLFTFHNAQLGRQIIFEEGKIPVFLGESWDNLFPNCSVEPLEHGILRVTEVSSDHKRGAVVVLMRPPMVDCTDNNFSQRLYSRDQLRYMTEQARRQVNV